MEAQLYAARQSQKTVEVVKIDPEEFKMNIRNRIDTLDELNQWLRLQGADSSMVFYLMALNGDEDGVVRCCEYTPINTCNEKGNTAVDLALIGDNFEAAKLLHRHGGCPNPRLGANRVLANAIDCFSDPSCGSTAQQNKLISNAIDVGFPLDTFIETDRWEKTEPWCYNYGCTLYAIAVSYANYEILHACLRNGADANKKLKWTHSEFDRCGDAHGIIDREGTPWSILSARDDMQGEKRRRFRELLLQYGATIAEE